MLPATGTGSISSMLMTGHDHQLHEGDALTAAARERLQGMTLIEVAPLLLAAVKATTAALGGNPLGDLAAWLQLLVVFDAVMIAAGAATYGHLLEE